MILNGYVAERFDPVRHLVFAMFGAAFCVMLFALSAAMGISGGAYFWYVLLIILFGLFQSASLPCTVKIVSGWFQPSSHGTVFGIWATNAVVGNLIGLGLASLLAKEEGSRALMPMLLVPALFIILVALCQLLLLQEGPFQLPSSPNGGVPFSQVLALPNVKTYTAAFSMVRTVDVSLFFWIVLYLNKHVGLSQASASLVAMTYDFGLVIGAFTSGKITDRTGNRPAIFAGLLFTAAIFALGSAFVTDAAGAAALMFMMGTMMGGPAMLMPTAIAADIGTRSQLAVTATISGIVDGTGSGIAALGQLAVGFISDTAGWTIIFILIAVLLAIGGVFCILISYWDKKKREPAFVPVKNADEKESDVSDVSDSKDEEEISLLGHNLVDNF